MKNAKEKASLVWEDGSEVFIGEEVFVAILF